MISASGTIPFQRLGYYSTKTEALAGIQGERLPDWYNITLSEVFERWKAQAWPKLAEKSQEMYSGAWKKLSPLAARKMREIRTAEERKIIAKAAACDAAARIVMILIYSGLRINELFSIRKSDVHLDSQTPHMIGGEKTEAGRNRTIPIALPVLAHVRTLMQEPGEYLVSNTQGGKKSYHNFREREYYPLLERLELPKRTLHTTRHTFASMMVEAGARPEDLQKIMGHADYSVTANIYNHANTEQLTKAIRLLG